MSSIRRTFVRWQWEQRRRNAQLLIHAVRRGDLEDVKKLAEHTGVYSWASREAAQGGFLDIMDYLHSLMAVPNTIVCGEEELPHSNDSEN
jgi:hypothetical protein